QVIVANVPAGATVIVYDDQGIEIGRGTNSSAQAGSVTIEELVEMAIDVEIQVSLLERDKSESAKVAVTPVFEQSAAPSAEQLTANATTDIVTVTNVPAGTTVKVYNEGSSTVIGTATNSGSSAVSIDVTIASGLGDGQEVEVTFTEPRKRESNGTVVEAEYDISVAPLSANITANGTAATLTVTNVPAGATAIVYDDQGSEIGRGTNSGAQAGSVTIDEL